MWLPSIRISACEKGLDAPLSIRVDVQLKLQSCNVMGCDAMWWDAVLCDVKRFDGITDLIRSGQSMWDEMRWDEMGGEQICVNEQWSKDRLRIWNIRIPNSEFKTMGLRTTVSRVVAFLYNLACLASLIELSWGVARAATLPYLTLPYLTLSNVDRGFQCWNVCYYEVEMEVTRGWGRREKAMRVVKVMCRL